MKFQPGLVIRALALVVLPLLVDACSKGAASSSGPDGSAPDSSTGTGGSGGAGGADGGASFWQRFPLDRVGEIPGAAAVHAASAQCWVRQYGGEVSGYTDHFITNDGGQTWTTLTSGFITPGFKETQFWVLGSGADGRLLARWTSPGSTCSLPCLPTTPGVEGTTYLMQLDCATKTWSFVDPFPATWADPPAGASVNGPSAQVEMMGFTSSLQSAWIYSPDPYVKILRFDGVGAWSEVVRPAGVTGAITATTTGDLFLFAVYDVASGAGGPRLFQLASGTAAWTELPVGPTSLATLTVAPAGTLYGTAGTGFFRRAAGQQTWETLTPSVTAAAGTRVTWSGGASRAGQAALVASQYASSTMTSSYRAFLSADGGSAWSEHTDALSSTLGLSAVAFDPDGRAYLHVRVSSGKYEIWRSPTPDRW